MHVCKSGIIFERSPLATEAKQPVPLPLLFSLVHPLKDVSPIVSNAQKGAQSSSFLTSKSKYEFVAVCEDRNLVVMYSTSDRAHSVWKIRNATEDDIRAMNLNVPYPSFAEPVWSLDSPSASGKNLSSSRSVMSPIAAITSKLSISSPSISKTRLHLSSSSPSSHLSPLLTSRLAGPPSPLARSFGTPTTPSTPSYATQSSPKTVTKRMSTSGHVGSPFNRLCATPITHDFLDFCDNSNAAIKPDLCFDLVWSDQHGQASFKASKTFVTTDFFKQTYLVCLIEQQQQVRLTRFDISNEGERLIFGAPHIIPGTKDVEVIKANDLLVIVDTSNALALYSGSAKVGLVHLPVVSDLLWGVSTPTKRKSSSVLQSSFKQSSFLSSSSAKASCSANAMPKFASESHMLSPVVNESSRSFEGQRSLPSVPSAIGVQDAVDDRVTVECNDARMFRFSLPPLASSTVVKLCINALKALLPKDICMQLLVKWYAKRNTHGAHTLSDSLELEMFKACLLTFVGYDIDDSNSSLSSRIVKKLKVEVNEKGTDDDWFWLQQHALDANDSFRSPVSVMPSLLFPYLPSLLFALHLTFEELKLDTLSREYVPQLIDVLFLFATDLRQIAYQDHYWRDFPSICSKLNGVSLISETAIRGVAYPAFFRESPPSVYHFLQGLLTSDDSAKAATAFPYIAGVTQRIRQCVLLYACIRNESVYEKTYLLPLGTAKTVANDEFIASDENKTEVRLLKAMHSLSVTENDLRSLPVGVALPLLSCIAVCRKDPPIDCSPECYALVGRQDLVSNDYCGSSTSTVPEDEVDAQDTDSDEHNFQPVTRETLKLVFANDQRVAEAYNLLQSSRPVKIAIPQRPGISDHDFIEDQERHLYNISIRTMALPVGRGMLTLCTYKPVVAETFPIPKLCLSGRVPPRNTIIELSHIDVPPNMNTWPLFHNGVAAGLRASPSASEIIDSSWIVYNKPKSTSSLANEAQNEHAGFLLALGLNGHLSKLSTMNIHDYLCKGNELTRVAVLLGLAAARRGSMDVSATKALSIHVEALLPPTSTELDVPPVVQVAAVLGIGLLYQSSGQHHIAEVLLGEIGRPPGPEMEHYIDRESYALSAGLAFGLVMLGKGNEMVSLVSSTESVSMADQLCNYMIGGYKKPLTTVQREKYKTPSYQIREGDYVNADVTSPGATLALGMLFFNTNNEAVAKWVTAPDTQYLLETVRPDFLLLRTLAKGLIMWSHIEATKGWVDSHIPKAVADNAFRRHDDFNSKIDYETMSQAYCNIVAGACMALGLKYAGSANEKAFKVVMGYMQMFLQLPNKPQHQDQAGRSTVECCLNVLIISLSLIMAGTGNVEVMRICRYLRSRTSQVNVVLYGSHMATHMALGFLFLGGCRYTISTAPEAIAALVCALFPKFPIHSNDNRYHLQAFRHLYALAVEPRLIIPRDIATGQLVYVHFRLKYRAEYAANDSERELVVRAPCLIPELDCLEEVVVDDSRYWKISFKNTRNGNWDILR